MAKDLVCNMDVDEKTAKIKTVYKGKTYYFCAPGCKKTFEAEPELYINSETSEDQHHTHHHHHEGEDTKSCCGCGNHHE
jgi:YHS domain-containing protein